MTDIPERVGWRRGAIHGIREVSFIVVGVLIALGANSWWENRREREKEGVNLSLLLAATRENQTRTATAIAFDSVSYEMAVEALQFVRTSSLPLTDTLDMVVWRALWYSDYHPLTGTYGALAASGDITSITNDALRAQIAEVSGEVAGAEQQMRNLDNVMSALGRTTILFFDAVGAATRTPSDELHEIHFLPGTNRSRGTKAYWATRQASPEFEGQLFALWSTSADRLNMLRRVQADLLALEIAIQKELSGL